MKKVLLSLLAVAALVLSCQNYDDEFAALNSKVASLESQISSLAGLQTALTQVQSSVTALQAAVSAIPNLSSEVAAILADLSDLETAVSGATTSADLDALKAELNTTLAALQALIEANSSDIASVVSANADLKTQLEALGVDVDAVLAANSTFEGNLTITNAAELAYAKSLGSKVASIKGDLIVTVDELPATSAGNGVTAAEVDKVLSQITFVVGNVRVTTDMELDLSALTTVSGDYSVVGHDVDDSALASVGDDVYVDYDGPISFPALTSVDRMYIKGTYVTTAATTSADAIVGTTSIDLLGLNKATSVSILNTTHTSGGSHTSGSSAVINDSGWPANELYLSKSTTSVKIGQAPITLVDGAGLTTLELHYKGDLNTTAATLAKYAGLSKTGNAALGNLSITAPKLVTATIMARQIGNVTVDAVASTATTATGTVDMPEALFVGAVTSDALENTMPKLVTAKGISLANDVAVSLPALTTSTGAISLPKATSFAAAELATLGASTTGVDLTADLVTGAVSFPDLTLAGDISMVKATSFDAKKAVVTSVDLAAEATSLDVASVASDAGIKDLATLTTINLHAQASTVSLSGAVKATSITVLGKTSAVDASFDLSSGYTALASLTLGGKLGTVSVSNGADAGKFKTLVTSGTIHQLTVASNLELSTLTLGHTEDVTDGAEISITGNTELTTFTTSADRVTKFVVTGNTKLASFDASSIATLPTNTTTSTQYTFTITGNGAKLSTATKDRLADYTGMKGTYTPLSATTSRSYGQASMATLKPYFQALYDGAYPATGVTATVGTTKVDIDLDFYIDNTPSTTGADAVTTTILLANSTALNVDVVNNDNDVSAADAEAGFLEILKIQ